MSLKEYDVSISINAKESLGKILDFIENRESLSRASNVKAQLISKITALKHLPDRYPRYNHYSGQRKNVRFIPFKTFNIVYRIQDDSVFIIDIICAQKNTFH